MIDNYYPSSTGGGDASQSVGWASERNLFFYLANEGQQIFLDREYRFVDLLLHFDLFLKEIELRAINTIRFCFYREFFLHILCARASFRFVCVEMLNIQSNIPNQLELDGMTVYTTNVSIMRHRFHVRIKPSENTQRARFIDQHDERGKWIK